MRLYVLFLAMCLLSPAARAQTVTIRNVSFPFTALEVGNTVEVKITGAAPNGTVGLSHSGGPPVTMGTTDGSGNWSITAVEEPIHVGSYHQTWLVNGVPLTPQNADGFLLPFAPKLPAFIVYANFVGSNCPPSSTGSSCEELDDPGIGFAVAVRVVDQLHISSSRIQS